VRRFNSNAIILSQMLVVGIDARKEVRLERGVVADDASLLIE
jgi:hypothetical protein